MMDGIVYVDGAFVPAQDARISVFDRGLLFADAVYEVTTVLAGRLIDNRRHLARLHRSLTALDMPPPMSDADIIAVQQGLIERNGLDQGAVYLQVTRGTAPRSFDIDPDPRPTLIGFCWARDVLQMPAGLRVVTLADQRWKRRDIKTTGLLAQSLAKTEATRRGADEAWMVEDGLITEGSSNNAFIVTADGTIRTRALGPEILAGITRHALIEIGSAAGYRFEERAFTIDEALDATEAFSSSASSFVRPVVAINGQPVGNGQPGPVATDLRRRYIEAALAGELA